MLGHSVYDILNWHDYLLAAGAVPIAPYQPRNTSGRKTSSTGSRTESRSKYGETKDEILMTTQAVLAEHGFHGLTTQRVADAAGVNQSLVHYHFNTKSGLVVAFFRDVP